MNASKLSDLSYQLVYDPSIISESRFEEYKDEEVAAKSTLVGPQRDDFSFFKKEIDVSRFGSRGEQRLAVLWLKLSELAFIENETGERPVLLLDDIFSELDDKSRQLVLEATGKQQTIITSAEEDVVGLVRELPHSQIIRLPIK